MHRNSKGKTKRKLLRLVALPNAIKFDEGTGFGKENRPKSPEKCSISKQLRNKVTKEIKVVIETHYRGLIEGNKDNPKKM